MAYQAIEVSPLTGALGAEVAGVDLSRTIPNQVLSEVHQAYLDHLVLCFRDQTLTPAQQVGVARLFGKPAIYPFLQGLEDVPEVVELVKTEADEQNFGGVWHSDTTYKEQPDLGTVLYAREVPEAGGDTLFANMYLAYEALSDGMKALLDGLVAVNSSEKFYSGGRARQMQNLSGMKGNYLEESTALEARHPVVRTHPETGRKGLFVNVAHTVRFEDMTAEESAPLIAFLCEHAVRPEFICRLRWRPGTLAIWDNRCTQHFAVNDYPGKRRRMHRVTIEGDVPH